MRVCFFLCVRFFVLQFSFGFRKQKKITKKKILKSVQLPAPIYGNKQNFKSVARVLTLMAFLPAFFCNAFTLHCAVLYCIALCVAHRTCILLIILLYNRRPGLFLLLRVYVTLQGLCFTKETFSAIVTILPLYCRLTTTTGSNKSTEVTKNKNKNKKKTQKTHKKYNSAGKCLCLKNYL